AQTVQDLARDRTSVAKVQPHPLRRRCGTAVRGNSTESELFLRYPIQDVVVAVARVVQIAPRGQEEFNGCWQARGTFVHRASKNPLDELRDMAVTQAAKAVLQVRFEVKNRVAEASMSRRSGIRQALQQ